MIIIKDTHYEKSLHNSDHFGVKIEMIKESECMYILMIVETNL